MISGASFILQAHHVQITTRFDSSMNETQPSCLFSKGKWNNDLNLRILNNMETINFMQIKGRLDMMKYWHLEGNEHPIAFSIMKRRAPRMDLIKRTDLGILEFLMPQETDLIVLSFL